MFSREQQPVAVQSINQQPHWQSQPISSQVKNDYKKNISSPKAVLRSRSFFDRLRLQVHFFHRLRLLFSYKNRLKISKKMFFALTSSHRLRLRPKSTGSGSATLLKRHT